MSEEEHAVTKWARSTDDGVLEFIVSSPAAFLGRPVLMIVVVDEQGVIRVRASVGAHHQNPNDLFMISLFLK